MKKLFQLAPLTVAIAAAPVAAQSTSETVAQMQQQLNAMQQQINQSGDDSLRFNGFFSTGYSRASNDAGYAGVTEETSIYEQSIMGLQGTFTLNDDIQAVMQLVGRGGDEWDAEMEWAYMSYRPTNELQLRAGKMRLPLFMYSDFLEVGYAQPWARVPQTVYSSGGLSSYMGADATYTVNLGGSSVTTQVYGGLLEDSDAGISIRNSGGAIISWTDYVWTLRAIAATGELEFPPLVPNERASFFGLGFSYDDGTWQIISEANRIEIDGFFTDTDAAYLSVGRRFGSITPYAVLGWIESQDDDERAGLMLDPTTPATVLNTSRDEYSLGLRWDAASGVAIKADWTHATGFEDAPNGLDPAFVLSTGTNSTNVYTLKLDAAF